MKRFHSSGTASGNVDVMWMWKMTIPMTAAVPSQPPCVIRSRIGSANSMTVPLCAAKAAYLEGRRFSGWSW